MHSVTLLWKCGKLMQSRILHCTHTHKTPLNDIIGEEYFTLKVLCIGLRDLAQW